MRIPKIVGLLGLLTLTQGVYAIGGDGKPNDGVVHGYVVDGTTKKPMAGVVVSASSASKKGSSVEVSTDADGYFRLKQVPPGDVSLQFEKKGYRIIRKEPVAVKEGFLHKLNVDMYMDKSGIIPDIEMEYPALRLIDGIL